MGRGMFDIHVEAEQTLRQIRYLTRRGLSGGIKRGMAQYLMLVKEKSLTFIRKDTTGLPKWQDSKYNYAKKRMQKTHPTKLTTRSGRLEASLREGGFKYDSFVNFENKRTVTDNKFQTLQGVITGGGKDTARSQSNIFEGWWSVNVKDNSSALWHYERMFKKGRSPDKGFAKKMIMFRFRHEKGLRGTARPFFYPAYLTTKSRLNEFVERHLQAAINMANSRGLL
jgi:hypothetical protein